MSFTLISYFSISALNIQKKGLMYVGHFGWLDKLEENIFLPQVEMIDWSD